MIVILTIFFFFFLVYTTSLVWFGGQFWHQVVPAPSRSQLRGIELWSSLLNSTSITIEPTNDWLLFKDLKSNPEILFSICHLYYIHYEIPTEFFRAFSIIIAYVAFNQSFSCLGVIQSFQLKVCCSNPTDNNN